MRAEVFRSVPAKLRFEHSTYRLGLTGIEPDAQLRRLLDQHLHQVNLLPEGLILSRKLAEILGVKPWDTLTVEVLEGVRPTRTVVVAGLLDELVAVSAYMNIHTLHKLMQEGGTICGAYLPVDALKLDRLYALLKRTPGVTGVSVREMANTRFQETIAGSLSLFTTVLVIFSCIIAFGVIYNAARIALSERGRELATLRIIGFNQAEVAFILLGEQAVLTVLAVPLDSVIGFGLCPFNSVAYSSELYPFPLVITKTSYGFASIFIPLPAIVSGLIVRRQLVHLDFISVLKTRE